jgi:hypothetical protein
MKQAILITKTVEYYGKTILIEKLSKYSDKKIQVECPVCHKGRWMYVKSYFISGHTICHSCKVGQRRKYLKIGKRYGGLVVIGHTKIRGYSICLCDCGKTKKVSNFNLTANITNSCGCLRASNFKDCPVLRGENHPNWKGGISGDRGRVMSTKIYKTWRQTIYEKDKFTCQKCGQVGYELNVHHIESYAEYENKRCEIGNGITFCKKCHLKFQEGTSLTWRYNSY